MKIFETRPGASWYMEQSNKIAFLEVRAEMWALECLKVKLPRYRHTVAPTHFQKQVGRGTWLDHQVLIMIWCGRGGICWCVFVCICPNGFAVRIYHVFACIYPHSLGEKARPPPQGSHRCVMVVAKITVIAKDTMCHPFLMKTWMSVQFLLHFSTRQCLIAFLMQFVKTM